MSTTDYFYQNILENMSDGVMTLEAKGRISMFNNAAVEILGFSREEILGKNFAEIFVMGLSGNDKFNQVILDAIYQSGVGKTSKVDFNRPDDRSVHLSITCSYLKSVDAGGGEITGLIIVFTDITELENLRKQEQKLYREIQDSCRNTEEINNDLQVALRKTKTVCTVICAIAAVLVTAMVIYFQAHCPEESDQKQGVESESGSMDLNASPVKLVAELPGDSTQTSVATAAPFIYNVSLSGILIPTEKAHIRVPANGVIKERYFQYGAEVEKGDLLAILDPHERNEKLEINMELHEIRTPLSGLVIRSSNDQCSLFGIPFQIGTSVHKGDSLATVANIEKIAVKAFVEGEDVSRIRIGQSVDVVLKAFPNIHLDGRVISIERAADYRTGDARVFEVVSSILDFSEILKKRVRPEMIASIDIRIYSNPSAVMIPLKALQFSDGQFYVTKRDKILGKYEKAAVEIGFISPSAVEITNGLSSGDHYSFPDNSGSIVKERNQLPGGGSDITARSK